jgi:signal peptidase II
MSVSKRVLLVLTVLISCVGCDQTAKSVATAHLSETESVSLLGGTVRLQVAKNYGAFLSLGASMPQTLRLGLLSIGVGGVLIGLLASLLLSKRINPIGAVAIALMVSGGLSNLIDRLQHGGYVVDFINIGVGPLRTGIFNAADMYIMLGVSLLVFAKYAKKN